MRKSKSSSIPQHSAAERSRGASTSSSSSVAAASTAAIKKAKKKNRKNKGKNNPPSIPAVKVAKKPQDDDANEEEDDDDDDEMQMDQEEVGGDLEAKVSLEDLSSQEDISDDDDEDDDDDDDDVSYGLHPRSSSALGGDRIRRPLSPYQPPSAFQAPVRPKLFDDDDDDLFAKKTKKKVQCKYGILYLSSIPPGFNVSRTTSFFAQFGQVGRVFLQPDEKEKAKSKDGMSRNFTEGWIEFMSKRVAKEVAANLNNTQVGGKKRSRAHDVTWNIKYLSKFKWTHLSERLAYEKAVHHQKMRTEISQAKREADFFKMNVERSKRLKRKPQKEGQSSTSKGQRIYEFRQKETDDVIRGSRHKEAADQIEDVNNPKVAAAGDEEASPTGPTPAKRGKQSRVKSKGKMGSSEKGKGKGKKEGTTFLQNVFGGD